MKQNQRETFRLNNVSSSHGQLPRFSHTNGRSCWSACIRSPGERPISDPLSHSFISQVVCTLIWGLAQPFIKHTRVRTSWHIHVSARWMSAPFLYRHWDACVLTASRMSTHTLVPSKREFLNGSISCYRHHCLLFSSISKFYFVILILLALCLIHNAEEGQASTENTLRPW